MEHNANRTEIESESTSAEKTRFSVVCTPFKFFVVGGVNTLVGLAVIYVCKWWLKVPDIPANGIGYGVGLCVSFILNKSWTFAYGGRTLPALGRFLLAFAVAYTANLLAVIMLIYVLHFDGYVAQAIAIIPYTLLSYLANRRYAFR